MEPVLAAVLTQCINTGIGRMSETACHNKRVMDNRANINIEGCQEMTASQGQILLHCIAVHFEST